MKPVRTDCASVSSFVMISITSILFCFGNFSLHTLLHVVHLRLQDVVLVTKLFISLFLPANIKPQPDKIDDDKNNAKERDVFEPPNELQQSKKKRRVISRIHDDCKDERKELVHTENAVEDDPVAAHEELIEGQT